MAGLLFLGRMLLCRSWFGGALLERGGGSVGGGFQRGLVDQSFAGSSRPMDASYCTGVFDDVADWCGVVSNPLSTMSILMGCTSLREHGAVV